MHLASGSFQLDDFQFVLILEWGAIFMASRFLVCKAANAAIKLFFCVILLAGLLRFVLHRDCKVALVLGITRIGVKGFFFGLLFLLLLCESVEAAACRQRDQHDHAQKAGRDLCDLVFLGLFRAGCCRFFRSFLGFFLGFQPVLFRLRRRFFFSGIGIGGIFSISASRSASSTRFIKWTVCAPLLFLSMTK